MNQIHLEKLTRDTVDDVLKLRVSKEQNIKNASVPFQGDRRRDQLE